MDIQARLEEIRNTSLQALSEAEVLVLLKERASLEESLHQEEAKREARARAEAEAAAERLAQEAKALEEAQKQEVLKNELQVKIKELSSAIHPEQSDEELIRIITERKALEITLRALENEAESPVSEQNSPDSQDTVTEPAVDVVDTTLLEDAVVDQGLDSEITETRAEVIEPLVASKSEPTSIVDEKITIKTEITHTEGHVGESGKASQLDVEEGRFALDTSLNTGEYQGYLSELKENLNSLGSFLQRLPSGARKNKAFMLEVARIDPAYAMHYADKDTLKKDEDFNVRIAGMNNTRNTGNPISEMLPEMRTSAVILVAVKNDFRNVRFLLPQMPDYETILALAQKGALESLRTLKNVHDIDFLIPPILQKDKKFMEEVKKITSTTLT